MKNFAYLCHVIRTTLELAATAIRRNVMKTQINTLVNGTTGIVGTDYATRKEVSEKVLAENGDTLRIEIKGIELELQRSCSCSGKSWQWSCDLTEEQYLTIVDGSYLGVGRLNRFFFSIDGDCRPSAQVSHRSNERKQWRFGYYHKLQEANIIIL